MICSNVWIPIGYFILLTFFRKVTFFSRNCQMIIAIYLITTNIFAIPMGDRGDRPLHKKNRKLVSLVSPNKLAPIKGLTENGDR